jgi:predicted MPP superfamily phosphohydrolase
LCLRSPDTSTFNPQPSTPLLRLAAGVVLAGAAAWVYATKIEATWLAVTRRELALPRLPAALDGLRVAHLSDFHLSRIVPRDYLEACVATAMAERPDLVLLTGDFVTRKPYYVTNIPELLRPLSAPLGVYAVLGNHDACVSAAGISTAVEASGARVLRNRNERVTANGAELWLAGIDSPHHPQYSAAGWKRAQWDRVYRRFVDTALRDIPSDAFSILLAHSPDVIRDAARRGVDLVLSGHTHGGQVRFPLLGATVVPSRYGHRYAAGLFQVEDTLLYVSRGLGTVRFPLRFLCRPELAIFTLRKQSG